MSQEPPKESPLPLGNRIRKTLKRVAFRGTLFYMGYSLLLLQWPKARGYNYRKWVMDEDDIIVSAHRCGSYDGLENTIPTAVGTIIKSKPRILHVDVRSTKDHVPILVHDSDLTRPCHQGRLTEEFNFKDLPKVVAKEIDIPFMTNPDGSPTMYKVNNMDSKRIESLEELLKVLNTTDDPENKTWLHLEFRGSDEQMLREAHRLLKEYKRSGRTFWGHVDDDMSEKLKKIDYNMARVASPNEVHSMFIKYWLFAYPYITREVHYKAVMFPYVNESFKANLRQQYGSSKYKNVGDGDNWKYRLRVKVLELMVATSGPLFRHLQKC